MGCESGYLRMRTRPFRADRREPTDPRSWRQTPVFVGDAVARIDNPTRLMLVTGVLPRDRVELVSVPRAEQAVGEIVDFDTLNDALADGRIVPRALPRREVAPVTESMAAHIQSWNAVDDAEAGA